MTPVLDASALIALLKGEPGARAVEVALEGADASALVGGYLSTVNLTEVLQVLGDGGLPDLVAGPRPIVVTVPYDAGQARAAASMLTSTRDAGLGLGDRACLAVAKEMSLPVLTADRSWSEVDVGVEVIQIR